MIHALRYTEELEKVGFTTEQAKKSVQVWMELMDQNFATKADFKEFYYMIKADQVEFRNFVKLQLDELRHDMNKQFGEVDKKFGEVDKKFGDVDKKFDDVRYEFSKFESKLDKLESKLTIKLGIMMAASIGMVSAIVGFIK